MADSNGTLTRRRVWLGVTVSLGVVVLFGALTVFSWSISETHFERQDDGFDRLVATIEDIPGVGVEARERWVEAPTFSEPTSWVSLTVDQTNLPALLEVACASDYTDTVTWALRVRTDAGDVVSLNSSEIPSDRSDGARCLDVGFDAVALVGEVDRVRPGVELQASIWDDERFALVALQDDRGLPALLDLVAHSEGLRDAAGLEESRSVEINAANLGLIIEPGEHDGSLALLSVLANEHGVTSFWADGSGTPIDGIEKVQIVAPEAGHPAIEAAVRASGLHLASFPVRFLPSE